MLTAALVALVAAALWSIGESDDWLLRQPWATLATVDAIAIGVLAARWRWIFAALLVLPLGLIGPEVGAPDAHGSTVRDWWIVIGPMYAAWFAVLITVG